jgi:hypothetical protein
MFCTSCPNCAVACEIRATKDLRYWQCMNCGGNWCPKGGTFDPSVSDYSFLPEPLRSQRIALVEYAKSPAGKWFDCW